MNKFAIASIITLLLSYILIRPTFMKKIKKDIFDNRLFELVFVVLGLFVGLLLITKYNESVGYLFIAALSLFVIDEEINGFTNTKYIMLKLMNNQFPESNLDYKNIPYHRYVDEVEIEQD